MGAKDSAKNFLKYGSFSIMPQVDPDLMRPLFEKSLRQLSFYSPKDSLVLRKTKKSDLRFKYSSEKQRFIWAGGAIYAQEPRKSFGDVDVVSFMGIESLNPDEQGEIFEALRKIAEGAGIEKVIACSSFGVGLENAARLKSIRGQRRFEHLQYGLGPSCG